MEFGKEFFLRCILRPAVKTFVWCETVLVDAQFLRRQGLTQSPMSRALSYPVLAWARLTRIWFDVKQEFLFERFSRLNLLHYGKAGRGYLSIATSSRSVRVQRYSQQVSRLERFFDRYSDLMRFEDGQSFLDLGCGTGQNIRALASRFPSSRIVGVDINEDALDLVRECEGSDLVSLELGNLVDPNFRKAVLSAGFDHIILSHVFAFLLAPSRAATNELRSSIISELIESCHSSIVIIDTFGPELLPTIEIEQRQRAVVSQDVLGLFADQSHGRAFLVDSRGSRAIVFIKEE